MLSMISRAFTRHAILLLLLLSSVVSAGAQEEKSQFRPRFMIGPTAGVNLSSVIFQPKVEQKLKLGYDGGIILRYDAVPYAGIWVEVDYSVRGWREVPELFPDKYYEQTLRFVNIPIMTHFMIGTGPFKFTIAGGTHLGVCLGESNRNNFPREGETPLEKVYIKHHGMQIQKKFAWGIGGGVGAEYHLPHIIVGARLSYVYGLGELFNNSVSDVFVKSSEQIFAGKAYVLFPF